MKFAPRLLAPVALLVAVAFTFAGSAVSFAKDATASVKGKVVKVEGASLTLKTGKKDGSREITVTTDDKTKVTIDGKDGKLADLKPGQSVTVTPADGTAQTIVAAAAKTKAPKDKTEKSDKPAK